LYICICSRINDQKKSHNTDLKEEMLEYIDSKFMDSNLCLSMMSMHFDLTEVYTSHFFKEQTGENFSIYLERLRINQAQELLTDTTLTIEDIAGRTGYNSSHAFRRAYKRVNGIVPTAARK
jgi:YesN/AraC family two-component response regulator